MRGRLARWHGDRTSDAASPALVQRSLADPAELGRPGGSHLIGAHQPGGLPGAPEEKALAPELRRAAVVALLLTVCGVALGLLWLWLAPRVPLISDSTAVFLNDSEGEEAIGADGTFVLLGLAFGAVSAALVFWFQRRGGIALVVALALGGLLGSLLAWRLGVWLGPTQDVVAHARAVGKGVVFDAPLQLRAKGRCWRGRWGRWRSISR